MVGVAVSDLGKATFPGKPNLVKHSGVLPGICRSLAGYPSRDNAHNPALLRAAASGN